MMVLARRLGVFFTTVFTVMVLSLGMASVASAQSADQLLASPKVDDIYAAQLDVFSESDFGDPDPDWGLVRVIRVTSKEIVVVTADVARYKAREALSDLKNTSYVLDLGWDFGEKITIQRADLAEHKEQGDILDARRLSASEIRRLQN